MFDLWCKIEEQGLVAVPSNAASLSALGWVEVGVQYPELMPEEFRRYDVHSDPQLILESPFVAVSAKGTSAWHFKAVDPVSGKSLDAWIDPMELASVFGRDYFHVDGRVSAFGGILVCSCGIAGCAGIWSQTFHVSGNMVHWSVVKDDDEIEFFFEREAYEIGAMEMLKSLTECPEVYTLPGPDDQFDDDALDSFRASVEDMLERRPYFREMWNEIQVVPKGKDFFDE